MDAIWSRKGARQARGGAYEIDGLRVRVGAFPVSIETAIYSRMARNAARSPLVAQVKDSLGGCRLILGVDRLDYSKGIPHRIKAFDRFLEDNPNWHSKVTLLQITPKSRSEIKEYSDIEAEVTTLIGKINGRFGDAAWTPIRYVNKSYSRTALAGIYRAADVAMVTPLRDGMNLVAKEYIAAQDPDDPGVLVLSEFAGAAKELDHALLINPHEIDGVASALKAGVGDDGRGATGPACADAPISHPERHQELGRRLPVEPQREFPRSRAPQWNSRTLHGRVGATPRDTRRAAFRYAVCFPSKPALSQSGLRGCDATEKNWQEPSRWPRVLTTKGGTTKENGPCRLGGYLSRCRLDHCSPGFGGVAGTAMAAAELVFVAALVAFALSALFGLARRPLTAAR